MRHTAQLKGTVTLSFDPDGLTIMDTPPCEREFMSERTKPIIVCIQLHHRHSNLTVPVTQAVVTATGAQGRSVCRAFWKSGYWHVRALTRDPSGVIARLYAAEGIEVVQADFEKKRELEAAFQGAFVVSCLCHIRRSENV